MLTFLWDPAGPGSSALACSPPPSWSSPGRVWPWCSCRPQSSADGPAPPGLWWWRPTKVEGTQSVKQPESVEDVTEILIIRGVSSICLELYAAMYDLLALWRGNLVSTKQWQFWYSGIRFFLTKLYQYLVHVYRISVFSHCDNYQSSSDLIFLYEVCKLILYMFIHYLIMILFIMLSIQKTKGNFKKRTCWYI